MCIKKGGVETSACRVLCDCGSCVEQFATPAFDDARLIGFLLALYHSTDDLCIVQSSQACHLKCSSCRSNCPGK